MVTFLGESYYLWGQIYRVYGSITTEGGGTFENNQLISNVPSVSGGTFEINRSISFVPESLGRLDPYGGTFEINRSMPFVPWQSLGTFGID